MGSTAVDRKNYLHQLEAPTSWIPAMEKALGAQEEDFNVASRRCWQVDRVPFGHYLVVLSSRHGSRK